MRIHILADYFFAVNVAFANFPDNEYAWLNWGVAALLLTSIIRRY